VQSGAGPVLLPDPRGGGTGPLPFALPPAHTSLYILARTIARVLDLYYYQQSGGRTMSNEWSFLGATTAKRDRVKEQTMTEREQLEIAKIELQERIADLRNQLLDCEIELEAIEEQLEEEQP
jgi:hypothetical protein